MTDGRRVKLTGASSPATAGRVLSRLRSGVRVTTKVRFEGKPGRIALRADDGPIPVEATGRLSAASPIRLCVVPDDLCFDSDYELALDVLEEPRVATFFVRGRTEISVCRATTPPRRLCVDFADLGDGRVITGPISHGGVTFAPLGDPLRIADLGEPQGQGKLAFPPTGLRTEFPEPVAQVAVTVNQYAGTVMRFAVFPPDGGEPARFQRRLRNEVRTIRLSADPIAAFEISGGANESSLVDVCFESELPAVAPLRHEKERRSEDA